MSWLSDAHTEWHIANGKDALCPLDCYDPQDEGYLGDKEYYDWLDWMEAVIAAGPPEDTSTGNNGWVKL